MELQTDADYQAALKDLAATKKAAIFDFTAKWCGPCKMITPVYESLAAEFPSISFYKVDIDKEVRAATLLLALQEGHAGSGRSVRVALAIKDISLLTCSPQAVRQAVTENSGGLTGGHSIGTLMTCTFVSERALPDCCSGSSSNLCWIPRRRPHHCLQRSG
jgi:thiol-disulfide isomerase/thioredoxin